MPARPQPAAVFKEFPEPEFPDDKARDAYRKARRAIKRVWEQTLVGESFPSLGGSLTGKGLTALPPEVGQILAMRSLRLSRNRLTRLPSEIGQISALTWLTVHGNSLATLPPEIGQLERLEDLDVSNNQLTNLPKEIGQLERLKELNLADNPLTALPPEICSCVSLSQLFLHGTPVAREMPDTLLGPTSHDVVCNKATPARAKDILDYYFSTRRASRPLDEARVLVVGRGEAGKTSLCRVLTGKGFDPHESETAGIEIGRTQVKCEDGGGDITLHLWDFAGQEITYALHRFFLAQQALYLLVLDNRSGSAAQDAEDWLRTIAAYAGRAPVIVAMTKQDKHPFHLDMEKLRRRWGAKFARMEFVRTDAQSGRGLGDLRRVLSQVAGAMPEVRQAFPVEYQEVKDRCEAMRERGDKRLTLEQFRTLCLEHGVKDVDGAKAADRADGLARILHNLGVVLHFVDDPRLRENTVLDPQWVTNGVYRLLRAREWAAEEAEARGAGATEAVLTLAAACAALPDESREAVGFLLSLMERFEMIYVLHEPPLSAGEASDDEDAGDEGRTWFMPAVLPEYQPELSPALASWREPDASELRLRFTYPLLPEGLVPRFIVRTWPLNEEMPRWRTGCFLREGRAEALISAERLDRTVEITVRGPEEDRVRLGRLVSRHMEAIHRDVPEKPRGEIEVRVKVGGHDESSWKDLRVLEKDEAATESGESTVETNQGTKPIVAATLLDKVSGISRREWYNAHVHYVRGDYWDDRGEKRTFAGRTRTHFDCYEGRDPHAPARVFVSYSHRDKRVCDVLLQNLSVMEQDGLIEAWTDNLIPSGQNWDEEIKRRLNEADLFVALVTTPFLGSKYINKTERPIAMERHKAGTLKLAWVIVEPDCAWKEADFSAQQVIQPGGRAVRQWGRMQDAFNSVEKTLRQMVARG